MESSPSYSPSESGKQARPIDVRTPESECPDPAESVPRPGSPNSDSIGSSTLGDMPQVNWSGELLCAPASSPDDEPEDIFAEILDLDAHDELALPNPGRPGVTLECSSGFSLPRPRRGPVGSLAMHRDYLNRAQRLMQDLKARDSSTTAHVSAIVAYIKQILLDDSQFVAGNWHHFAELWASHLRSIPRWPQRAKVLEWIRQGYPIDWVDPESEAQQAHPRFKIKKREVEAMLEQVLATLEIQRFTTGTRPTSVVFPNRRSAMHHEQFTDSAICGLVETGMAVLHDPAIHAPEIVVNPLAVVVQRTKKRLVVDLWYVNRFV